MPPPDPARWAALQTLLAEALGLEPADRAAFVARHAEGDADLAEELAGLLDAADAVPAFLDAPPAWSLAGAPDAEPDFVGRAIGPYRLVGELGRGGQGRVFLAERDDLRTRVALKVLRSGLAAPDLVDRFLTERRVLAGLDHPHIARLLDAGVTEAGPAGERAPYYVMELVEGEPLTAYAESHGLGLRARLVLFLQVCEAVRFAHSRLVVHRDLKPSNILVAEGDGGPSVKLLDFGIAKLLDDESEAVTRTGLRLLTPEYAAPEQVLGADITVATDVYGLGAVLYELLAGARPLSPGPGLGEAVRAACEVDPPRPSVRAGGERGRRVRGDLDAIALKALEKAPADRYGSAGDLADDVRRHLEGRPVRARRQTVRYRAVRFVRRNALGVGLAILAVALVGTFVGREAALRAESERARDEAQARAALLSDIFGATDDGEAIRPDTLRAHALLSRAARRLDERFEGPPRVKAALTLQLGQLYDRIERPTWAASRYREAERLARAAGADDVRADALLHIAYARSGAGRCAEALAPLDEALRLRTDDAFTALARSSRGGTLACLGRHDEAVADLVAAERLQPDDPGFILHSLADAYHRAGRPEEALAAMRESVARGDAHFPRGHTVPTARRHLLSQMLTGQGDYGAAERVARRAYADASAATAPTDNRTLGALLELARVVRLRGDLAAADSLSALLVERARRTLPSDVVIRFRSFHLRSRILLALGRTAEAEGAVREALATPLDPARAYLRDREGHYRTLAEIARIEGRTADAAETERRARAVVREVETRRVAEGG